MERVVVTGLGVITPVGNNLKDFWSSLCEGRGGIDYLKSFDASEFTCRIAGEVTDFEPLKYFSPKDARRMERFVQFAVAAAKMALSDSGLEIAKEDSARIGTIVGSGIGSLRIIEEQHKVFLKGGPGRITPFLIPMLIVNMAPGQIAIQLGIQGPNSCVATACASGTHAIGEAFRVIQRQEADVMFTGGTESCITILGIGGFCAMKALSLRNDDPSTASRPFDRDRDGFVMGEGSGIVVLESLSHARKRGANIYAEVVGYGMTGDAYHMTAPRPDGEGAAKAMRIALEDAHLSPDDISYINAHGTSTVLNDKIETMAIKKVFGEYAKKLAVSSTKSMTGHLLGAAGGVEFAVIVKSVAEGTVHPTINYINPDPECGLDYVPNHGRKMDVQAALSNSLGFGGHNASIIVKKFL